MLTGQGEDYTTGCLLDYEYIKNHYRLAAVDLSWGKEIRCRFKSNSTNRIRWTIKKLNGYSNATNAGNDQSMFVLTILEKIKETRLKFSQGTVILLRKIPNSQEARVKLTKTQLNKLKSAAKK